jgi:hypothetical protein
MTDATAAGRRSLLTRRAMGDGFDDPVGEYAGFANQTSFEICSHFCLLITLS